MLATCLWRTYRTYESTYRNLSVRVRRPDTAMETADAYKCDSQHIFLPRYRMARGASEMDTSRCFAVVRRCHTGEAPNLWVQYERTRIKTDAERIRLEKLHRNNVYNNYMFHFIFYCNFKYLVRTFVRFDAYYYSIPCYGKSWSRYYNAYNQYESDDVATLDYLRISKTMFYLSHSIYCLVIRSIFPYRKMCAFPLWSEYVVERNKLTAGVTKHIDWTYLDGRESRLLYFSRLPCSLSSGYHLFVPLFHYLDYLNNTLSGNAEVSYFPDRILPTYEWNRVERKKKLFRWRSSPRVRLHKCKYLFYDNFRIFKLLRRLNIRNNSKRWKILLSELLYIEHFNPLDIFDIGNLSLYYCYVVYLYITRIYL
jgi:hypothetical protein